MKSNPTQCTSPLSFTTPVAGNELIQNDALAINVLVQNLSNQWPHASQIQTHVLWTTDTVAPQSYMPIARKEVLHILEIGEKD